MDGINKQLYDLYASKWSAISDALQEIANVDNPPEPTNPFLLYIDKEEEWKNADLRVMIFGQETCDWEDWPNKSIEHLCDVYDRGFNKNAWINSPFWRGITRFKSIFDAKYPNKKIKYIWNNIIKIGKIGKIPGCPPPNIYEVEHEYFHVIPEEVKILKPNIILFLTGPTPTYNNAIRDNFGEVAYSVISPYEKNELVKISISNIDFAFRTYHPNFFHWKKQNVDDYFNVIIKEITY
jgi:hypothetical protein